MDIECLVSVETDREDFLLRELRVLLHLLRRKRVENEKMDKNNLLIKVKTFLLAHFD